MGRRMEPAWSKGTVGLTTARERGDIHKLEFESRLRVTRSTIDRLGLEKELRGHGGCVNCLEWNSDGSVLASASDDLHVMLWDPYRYKILHNLTTGHTGNIFSVKFVSRNVLATCAADSTVRVSDIVADTAVLECSCHCGRVKRIATTPDNHNLMWTAAEDGFVLQHDLRVPHRCNNKSNNVAVSLVNNLGRYAEAKCVAVNPRRSHMLAVGANDFYVRMYDTRMINLMSLDKVGPERPGGRAPRLCNGDLEFHLPRAACQYYSPGHLTVDVMENIFPKKAVTYLNFSHDGNELLVNLGSEQIYIFDVNSARRPVLVDSYILEHNQSIKEGEEREGPKNGTNGTIGPLPEPHPLPDQVQTLKEIANELVSQGKYPSAVEQYNDAIALCPDCAILYSNRAAALMRRAWSGDTYAAIRDCYRAIRLDHTHVKSHFRLAKGLMDLKRAREAHECLLYFKDKFPRHAKSHAVFLLQKDINSALEKKDSQSEEVHTMFNNTFDESELSDKYNSNDSNSNSGDGSEPIATSPLERHLRSLACDYSHRFLGHCNTTTDIKEANFLGPDSNYVAAGSDDGSLFIWCRRSGNIVRCLRGDDSIVNCVQMHPSMFLLATSGIEAVVRLWTPQPEEGSDSSRVISDPRQAAAANQQRMRSDPFEAMLLNISLAGAPSSDRNHPPPCRTT